MSDEAVQRLVCVPYAGGGAAVYHGWGDLLPGAVEPWTLRLPGRDGRMREPLRTGLVPLAREAAGVLAGMLGERPFALFGHSLGALVAFEIARALQEEWSLAASLLAVSARNAPQAEPYQGQIHRLPDEEFLSVLDQRYGAIPPMIRDDEQLRSVYLPVLRADVTMLETYRHRTEPSLRCPIVAFGGTDDPTTDPDGLAAWGELTDAGSRVVLLPDGHFYVRSQPERVVAELAPDLLRALVP